MDQQIRLAAGFRFLGMAVHTSQRVWHRPLLHEVHMGLRLVGRDMHVYINNQRAYLCGALAFDPLLRIAVRLSKVWVELDCEFLHLPMV